MLDISILTDFLQGLGIDDPDLGSPTIDDQGEYLEGVIFSVPVDVFLRKITSNPILYNKMVYFNINEIGIVIMERINNAWTHVYIQFSRHDEGSFYQMQVKAVEYVGETGENLTVPSFAVYNSLVKYEKDEISFFEEE